MALSSSSDGDVEMFGFVCVWWAGGRAILFGRGELRSGGSVAWLVDLSIALSYAAQLSSYTVHTFLDT